MNYIITNNEAAFTKLGDYNFCKLEDMVLPNIVAVDTETTGLQAFQHDMFSVQIGTGKDNYLIDMQVKNNGIKFEKVIPYLRGKGMVFHNAVFDLGFFYKHNFYPKKVYDTFIASKIIYNGYGGGFRHDFGSCMSRELGITYDKSEQKNIWKVRLSTAKAIQYCFNDVDRLLELMKTLSNKAREFKMIPALNLHFRYIRALAYMEQSGVPVDADRWDEKMVQDEIDLSKAETALIEYIHYYFPHYRDNQIDLFSSEKKILLSLSSPKQMHVIFEELGINILNDDEKKSLKKEILSKSSHEFLDLWYDYQDARHDITTYGQNIKDKIWNGRVYANFNPILDTARISTRKGDWSVNTLNLPANPKTRRCFKAREGYKLICADYSGQENVVGADLHQDPMMVASIKEGLDLHCAFARLIFEELADLSDEEIIKNHSKSRKYAKSPRFAKAYGGSGYTIAKNLNVSLEEGERLDRLYDELHPKVKEWGLEVLDKAIEKGCIESVDGFRLHLQFFDEFLDAQKQVEQFDNDFWIDYKIGKKENMAKLKHIEDEVEGEYVIENYREWQVYMDNREVISKAAKQRSKYYRLCLNNPIQTRSAFQTKRAACMLFETIEANNHLGRVLICVIPHDEFLLEVEEALAEQYATILEECMITGGNHYLNSGLVHMQAEANIADDWEQAK